MSQVQDFKNLVEMTKYAISTFASNPRFGTKKGSDWEWLTYAELGILIDQFRGGLAQQGVQKGDGVAVIANNRVEWAVGAYATYGLGALYVPMYEKQLAKDWEYILTDSKVKVVLVATQEIANTVKPFVDSIDSLERVICFEGSGDDSYSALLTLGKANPVATVELESDDLAGLIYTSGTTGKPKGVKLSHANIMSNVNSVQRLFPMEQSDRSLSFLPWAHSFGQTCELHVLFSYGASSALNSSVDKLLVELGEVKPTVFFSVPRVYNKIYDGVRKKVAAGSPFKQKLFAAAFRNAEKRKMLSAKGEKSAFVNFKHGIFDKLVFSKVRASLGGRLKYAFSGGAAISTEVMTFVDTLGVTIYEGYGLSETSPIATINYPDNRRIGTVGKAIHNVEIIIDTDAVGGSMGNQGEILIKGPNIMKGYLNLPDQTSDVIREDGAFRTGDLGELDADGFLKITGRIKEQYKLENGKYVVPTPLEDQLNLSGFITQSLVFGDNKLFNVALIIPDFLALSKWGEENGVSGSPEELVKNDKVIALIQSEIDAQQKEIFKGYERTKAFHLLTEEFTVDNGMLTPKLSMKRRVVISTFQAELDALYAATLRK